MEEKEGMFIANSELTDEERKKVRENFKRVAKFVSPGLMESDKFYKLKIVEKEINGRE